MGRDALFRGVPVAISTLVWVLFEAGDLLAAIDDAHGLRILDGSWLHTDSSSVDMVVEGHPGVARKYIDVLTRKDLAVSTSSPAQPDPLDETDVTEALTPVRVRGMRFHAGQSERADGRERRVTSGFGTSPEGPASSRVPPDEALGVPLSRGLSHVQAVTALSGWSLVRAAVVRGS